ncbi:MAG: FAD-dependent oxidoreductase, partial [Acidobacteriota bacterium]
MRRLAAEALAAEVRDADALVIGTGVAGLSAALALSPRRVTVLTKSTLGGGGSSPWAQGGVAAAMSSDDSSVLHAEDTRLAGAGLCDAAAVSLLTDEGPVRLRELIGLGARFDRGELGELKLGREGAHSRRRILHAGGDATGREMVRALVAAVRREPQIEVAERAEVTDLVRRD